MLESRLLEIALGNAGFALLLALAIACLNHWVRRPALLHLLWLVVLCRLVTPPILELALLPPPAQAPPAIVTGSSLTPIPFALDAVHAPALDAHDIVLLVWALGAALLMTVAAVRTIRLIRALRQAREPDPSLVRRLAALADTMKVPAPSLRLVSGNLGPMLWAAFSRPVLILPHSLLPKLSDVELDAVLTHELAHVRRRDHWIRYLELCAVALCWWNPVAWWASHRLRWAEEACCDAMVTERFPDARRAYVQGLVKAIHHSARATVALPAVTTGASQIHAFEERIRSIMTRHAFPTLTNGQRVVTTVLAFAVLLIGPTLAVRATQGGGTTTSSADQDTVFVGEPITLTLSGADLSDVLRTFAQLTNLTVAVSPGVEVGMLATPVTIEVDDQPWDQALDKIIRQTGLAWTLEGNLLWVHLPGETPGAQRTFSGEPITLNLENAKLEKVLSTFSSLTGYSFDLEPGISTSVTIRVTDMPWDQVLDLILRVKGLTSTVSGNQILISRAPEVGAVLLGVKPRPQLHTGVPTGEVFTYTVDGPISEPRAIYRPNPVYPAAAKEAKITGDVILETTITADGRVADIDVIKPQSDGFTEAALEAIKQWRFEPALLDGVPVAVKYVLNVHFTLE